MKGLTLPAKLYIITVIAAGMIVLGLAFFFWESSGLIRFGSYLLLTLLASGFKVTLPGITGTMSVSYVFVLLGVTELKPSETVLISGAAMLAQTYWHTKKPATRIQALFNVSSIAMATAAACYVYRARILGALTATELALAASACAYFVINTFSIAGVVALTEQKNVLRLWRECYFWSFAYYLLGAFIANLVSRSNRYLGWGLSLLTLPVLYVIYRSYRLYLGRLEDQTRHAEDEKKHAQAIAALHLRTIEAMALAIEAKDTTTHQHLERVQAYAVAIGQELGIPDMELEALRAAAILHDIGKLAVPEHIISKPGKLTLEEFEKMKIHPSVGGDILDRVQFPYPVAPIVRSHHERWDGSGYPDGLAGEQIPIGARILAAVDCLDALASDRQYRRAVPLDEAMEIVALEAGKTLDARVVEVLQRRYRELEQIARRAQTSHWTAERPKITRGESPAVGFEKTSAPATGQPEFLLSIAAAREEMQGLYELTAALGSSLSLHQTLSVLDARLKRMIPYEAIGIYVLRNRRLMPEYVQGEDSQLFSSLEIPLGEGLSGWVADHATSLINGDPSLEPSYLKDPEKLSKLRSGLAVPLEGINGLLGVLTLYASKRDAFSRDHLRVLLAISSKASLAIENALEHRQVEISATTDALTGLPNARSLFLRLDAELSRCRRSNTPLTILVCDLDGFKQVNDRFGHLEGNKVLKLVAQGLIEGCREYDYVARMGGDEFVLVLPGLRPEVIQEKSLALNRMVRRVGADVCGEDLLSISVGDAYYPQHGGDAEQLLAQADRRMYRVKQEHKMMIAGQGGMLHIQSLSTAIQ